MTSHQEAVSSVQSSRQIVEALIKEIDDMSEAPLSVADGEVTTNLATLNELRALAGAKGVGVDFVRGVDKAAALELISMVELDITDKNLVPDQLERFAPAEELRRNEQVDLPEVVVLELLEQAYDYYGSIWQDPEMFEA